MAKGSLSGLTISQMLAEIKRRQRAVKKLTQKRDRLLAAARALDAEIQRYGGEISGASLAAGGQRARNKLTLPEAMLKAMATDRPMSVAEIAAAVEKVGYVSVSKTFRTIIYQTLGKDKRFKKVARGRYVIKS